MDGFVEPMPSEIKAMEDMPAPPAAAKIESGVGAIGQPRRSTWDDDRISLKRLSFDGKDEEKSEPKLNTVKPINLTAKQKKDIADAFNAFDISGSGFITQIDLRVAFRALGFEVREEVLKKIFLTYDTDDTGKLCYSDFLAIIGNKLNEPETKEDLVQVFALIDRDEQGKITFDNLRQIAVELGEDINEEEILEMIAEGDYDDDGALQFEEFFQLLRKTDL